jgi:hypothetical protein
MPSILQRINEGGKNIIEWKSRVALKAKQCYVAYNTKVASTSL